MADVELIDSEIIYSTGAENRKLMAHRHDWHEINVVYRGPYQITIGGSTFTGETGSVFYVPALTVHHVQVSLRGNTTIGNVRWTASSPTLPEWKTFQDTTGRWMVGVRWLAELMHGSEAVHDPEASNGILRGLLAELRKTSRPIESDLALRVHSYLQFHLASKITLSDLAADCNCSAQHLVRVFKRRFGCTPMQSLQSMRCDLAHALAATDGISLTEIAARCGFRDAAQLAHVVKRQTGRPLRASTVAGRLGET